MVDRIITGASRGIGRALTRALAPRIHEDDRFFLLARDESRLSELAAELALGERCIPMVVDLSVRSQARRAGHRLASEVRAGATLIHNAGVWPTRLQRVDGLEIGFAVNCVAPLELQAPLLAEHRLGRVLAIGAGLMVKGRFDPERTPTGRDFSRVRTYASTKLAGAVAIRRIAHRHPEVDFAVVHPGVVRTDLGDPGGVLAPLVRWAKRGWESPETCAARLVDLLERPRWQATPGIAPWWVEDAQQPWPNVVDQHEDAVRQVLVRLELDADR